MINTCIACYRRLVPLHKLSALLLLLAVNAMETTMFSQQNEPNRTKKSTSLMLQFYGPEALGVHVNQNITRSIALNFGLGLDLGAHLGMNAYLTNRNQKRFAWYGGVQTYFIREFTLNSGNLFGSSGVSESQKRDSQLGVYIPIGFEYIANKGFTLQLDIGPNLVGEDWGQSNTAPVMGSLKIGYTFRAK